MKKLNLILIVLLFLSCNQQNKNKISLLSPNEKIKLNFGINDSSAIYYSVEFEDSILIQESQLGFQIDGEADFDKNLEIISSTRMEVNQSWEPVYGEKSKIKDYYNLVNIHLKEKVPPAREFEITFRIYDEGVAFNYTFLPQTDNDTLILQNELTEFKLKENYPCWVSDRAQSEYRRVPVNSIIKPAERPLVIETGEHVIALGEAKLVNFARMKLLSGENDNSLIAALHGEAKIALPYSTPWRTIMIGKSPGELLENNYFFQNLNDPCAIEDVSWIKPGKVIREVTLTTQGGKACVDFAAKNNFRYVEFDSGWYTSDATTISVNPRRSPGPLDLHEVIEYAQSKGIGIIVYVGRRALEQQLDEILPLYKSWGIKGVKYGFVQVGSQKWTSWLHEAVKKAAENQLMVDIHDEYRPTGFSRTYPNLMTQEGIRGDEESPSNEHTLITLFTRMLAGAGDNTNCYYASRVSERMGGHISQLAKAIMLYSPWNFLYWYDRPQGSPGKKGGAGSSQEFIQNHPELEFFKQMPVVWDETKVLEGRIGKFATIARKTGDNWFLGSLTSKQSRIAKIDLDFLESGVKYQTTVYSHNPKSESLTRVEIEKREITSISQFEFEIGANSGLAVHFQRIK